MVCYKSDNLSSKIKFILGTIVGSSIEFRPFISFTNKTYIVLYFPLIIEFKIIKYLNSINIPHVLYLSFTLVNKPIGF